MKYYIIHRKRTDLGEAHEKWLPSAHYELSADYLLKQMEAQPRDFDFLVIPFVLTLSAGLEANLNDWIIVDTFAKHGPGQYKSIAEGYMAAPFAKKLRIIVPVLTDNRFQLREDSTVVEQLDKLIAVRNKITHPLAHYRAKMDDQAQGEPGDAKLASHPLHSLTLVECKKFHSAVSDFDEGFFHQYDLGHIGENDLIRELRKAGEEISEQAEE